MFVGDGAGDEGEGEELEELPTRSLTPGGVDEGPLPAGVEEGMFIIGVEEDDTTDDEGDESVLVELVMVPLLPKMF